MGFFGTQIITPSDTLSYLYSPVFIWQKHERNTQMINTDKNSHSENITALLLKVPKIIGITWFFSFFHCNQFNKFGSFSENNDVPFNQMQEL